MSIEATIARVLELDEKATPGPWDTDFEGYRDAHFYLDRDEKWPETDDLELMDYYRTAAPELARECRRLGKSLECAELLNESHVDRMKSVYALRQRIIDVACLRDDVSDDDLVSCIGLAFELRKSHEAWKKAVIDAACLRDDVSHKDIVDAVSRLASPSGEVPEPDDGCDYVATRSMDDRDCVCTRCGRRKSESDPYAATCSERMRVFR